MASMALMFGGPKKDGESKMEDKHEDSEMSGKTAAAKAAFEAVKGTDVAEFEKALTAFVRACAEDQEQDQDY